MSLVAQRVSIPLVEGSFREPTHGFQLSYRARHDAGPGRKLLNLPTTTSQHDVLLRAIEIALSCLLGCESVEYVGLWIPGLSVYGLLLLITNGGSAT